MTTLQPISTACPKSILTYHFDFFVSIQTKPYLNMCCFQDALKNVRTVLEEVVACAGGEDKLTMPAPPSKSNTELIIPRLSKSSPEVKQAMNRVLDDILMKAINMVKTPKRELKKSKTIHTVISAYYDELKTETKVEETSKEDLDRKIPFDNKKKPFGWRMRQARSEASLVAKKPIKKSIITSSIVDAYKQAVLDTKPASSISKTVHKAKKSTMRKFKSICLTSMVAAYKQASVHPICEPSIKVRPTTKFKVRRVREGRRQLPKRLSKSIVEAYKMTRTDAKITTKSEAEERLLQEQLQELQELLKGPEETEEDAELWDLALDNVSGHKTPEECGTEDEQPTDQVVIQPPSMEVPSGENVLDTEEGDGNLQIAMDCDESDMEVADVEDSDVEDADLWNLALSCGDAILV